MEKAIDIKRRAQRCIQNGDLDGALNEYEKLVGSEDSDPYNYVLLADLLYKKGDHGGASERYLSAVGAYEHASLYKNAIAVCKKMLRLALSPAKVLHSLGNLHALDGLSGEAALYYVQYAEHMVRASAPADAAHALRRAFDVCQDNLRVLEQLSEAWLLAGENGKAGEALLEAANLYRERGSEADARRCTDRAEHLEVASGAAAATPSVPAPAWTPAGEDAPTFTMARLPVPSAEPAPSASHPFDRGVVEPSDGSGEPPARGTDLAPAPPLELDRFVGFETGRHEPPRPMEAVATPAPEPEAIEIEPSVVLEREDADVAGNGDQDPEHDEVVIVENDEESDDADVEYEIEDETGPLEVTPIGEHVAAEPREPEPVYEIAEDEVISFEATPSEESSADPVYEIADESLTTPGTSPAAPGLSFQPPAVVEPPAPTPEESAMAEVEALLAGAQGQFRAGDRETASHTLTHAAQAYEALNRLENAATIYRSLGKGAHSTPEILELWLHNCERRRDGQEAATVACDLGDRALNDGDEIGARKWFERAMALDVGNETAGRRLERLTKASEPAIPPMAMATAQVPVAEPQPQPAQQDQRVEIAVGRAEAVSFDLAGLLAEFQRGVESQLAGDAQSHYDLGMTYREMGLHAQAMESFRNAEQDPRFAARAAEMSARCLADQGRYSEAAGEFQRALALPGVDSENDIELRYHFGTTLVELGRLEEALPQFERVIDRMPEFEDAGVRLTALRRTLGRA